MTNLNSAALICRVSTREQESGYSLEAQEQLLREHCVKLGFEIVTICSFSETASKYYQRKKFQEFMREVKRARIYHIVAEKVDRLSRSGSRDAFLIDEWIEEDANRHTHFVKQSLDVHKHAPASVKFVWSMHVAVAKHMSDNLSEEVIKSTNVMLSKGIWPTRPPIGYYRDEEHPTCPIQINVATSDLVVRLFNMYDSGDWSIARLAEKAHELGLRNTQGKRIPASRIHTLLKDCFYIGQMRYRGVIWRGVHEPLISVHLFDRVQSRMKGKISGRGATTRRRHQHLMRDLAVCQSCSKRLTWESHGDRTYAYCRNRGQCQHQVARREDGIEVQVIEWLKRLEIQSQKMVIWIHRALVAHDTSDKVSLHARTKQVRERLTQIERKLSRLIELRLDGELTREESDRKRSELELERQRIDIETDAIGTLHDPLEESRARLFMNVQSVSTSYLGGEPEVKREILTKVFDEIAITNDCVSATFKYPYNFLEKAVLAANLSTTVENVDSSKLVIETQESGSKKEKDRLSTVGHPIWWAEWDRFRHSEQPTKQT